MVNVGSESGVKYKIIKADSHKLLYIIVYMFFHLHSSHGTTYSCHQSQPRSWQGSVHGALKGFIVGHGGNENGRKSLRIGPHFVNSSCHAAGQTTTLLYSWVNWITV